MKLTYYDNVAYILIIITLLLAIIVKYLCEHVFNCDTNYNNLIKKK